MRGVPRVLWTCDRCGSEVTTDPTERLPSGWRRFSVSYPTGGDDWSADRIRDLCGACTSRLKVDLEGVCCAED